MAEPRRRDEADGARRAAEALASILDGAGGPAELPGA